MPISDDLWWMIVAAANGVVAVAYTAIAWAIMHGLWRTGQWRRNPLGVATAAIFVTCAVHHGSHTMHMLLPSVGMAVDSGLAMRTAMGHDFYLAAWDTLTAMVGVWYWGLRGRFPALVKGAAVFDDLRLREAGEQALRASEERYRRIVETTSEGILTTSSDGRVTYANQRLADMVGRRVEEIVGRPVVELAPAEDHATILARVQERHAGPPVRHSSRLLHRDGHLVPTEVSPTPLYGEDGRFDGSLAMIADVTEQRSLEAQFRQSQKLEAIGQLAGGVAHDFNNLLTVIDGYTAMLLEDAEGQPRADLEAIRAATVRAQDLTRQLLTFSRAQVTQPRVLAVNEVVTAVEGMVRRLIGEDIRLSTVLNADAGWIFADRSQLEQVLVNLVVNARDAMPSGGELTIGTEVVDLDPAWASQVGVEPGRFALIAVHDTGIGIPPDIQARVFDPFFTTKAPGKGTGLGLSTAYGIAHEAGGHITVHSVPDGGSTFRLYLPLAEHTNHTTPAPTATPPPVPGHGETILLVEDDTAVRELAHRILTAAGYRVLDAADAEMAEIAAAGVGKLNLLLTDIVMPGRNGRELAEHLLAARPHLRVLFTSAYARGIITDRGILDRAAVYLEKPYTPAQLTQAVRTILDAPTGHDDLATPMKHRSMTVP